MRRVAVIAALLAIAGMIYMAPVHGNPTSTQIVDEPARVETFEAYSTVTPPDPDDDSYTFDTHGTGGSGFVSGTVALNSSKSLLYRSNGNNFAAGLENIAGFDLCNAGAAAEFSVQVNTSAEITFGFTQNVRNTFSQNPAPSNTDFWSARIKFDATGNVFAISQFGTNTAPENDMGFDYQPNTWYTFRVSETTCAQSPGGGTHPITFCELTNEVCVTATSGFWGASETGIDSFVVDSSAGGLTAWFDDVTWTAAPPPTPVGEVQTWCPDPGQPSLGYNLAENVVFDSNLVGFDLSDGYLFEGDGNDEAFAFKVWNHTTRDVSFHATLESGTEGASTEFFVYFFSQDPATWLNGDFLDPSATGDGQSTGLLSEAVVVQFEESGNDWRISAHHTHSGGFVDVGQAWIGGSPNTPTSFIVRSVTGIAEPDAGLEVFGPGNTKLLDVFAFEQDTITGVGIVSQSGQDAFEATTVLNEDEDTETTHNSSCYFFNDVPEGDGDFVGAEGATAKNQDNTLPEEEDPGTSFGEAPEGSAFDTAKKSAETQFGAGGGLFLMVLLTLPMMVAIGGVTYSIGRSAKMGLFGVAGGFACGVMLSLAFGFIGVPTFFAIIVLTVGPIVGLALKRFT